MDSLLWMPGLKVRMIPAAKFASAQSISTTHRSRRMETPQRNGVDNINSSKGKAAVSCSAYCCCHSVPFPFYGCHSNGRKSDRRSANLSVTNVIGMPMALAHLTIPFPWRRRHAVRRSTFDVRQTTIGATGTTVGMHEETGDGACATTLDRFAPALPQLRRKLLFGAHQRGNVGTDLRPTTYDDCTLTMDVDGG